VAEDVVVGGSAAALQRGRIDGVRFRVEDVSTWKISIEGDMCPNLSYKTLKYSNKASLFSKDMVATGLFKG